VELRLDWVDLLPAFNVSRVDLAFGQQVTLFVVFKLLSDLLE
jgi:hypothetical protein